MFENNSYHLISCFDFKSNFAINSSNYLVSFSFRNVSSEMSRRNDRPLNVIEIRAEGQDRKSK